MTETDRKPITESRPYKDKNRVTDPNNIEGRWVVLYHGLPEIVDVNDAETFIHWKKGNKPKNGK